MKMDLRTVIDQFVMLIGVVLVVGPVTLVEDSLLLLGSILVGMSLIGVGVWRLASQMLPDRRVYIGLRDEVERFIGLVRRLNSHALTGNEALKEDVRAAMHESVDRMFDLAGDADAHVEKGAASGSS